MRTRDWAGTVLVACLIAVASLLRNHMIPLVIFGMVALGCVLLIVWDVSRDRALASMATMPVSQTTQQQSDTVAKLTEAAKLGRRLLAEAGELDPIGNMNRLSDLVRRYNAWEGGVADVLADDDLPSEWRDAWLTDDQTDTFPITREALDRMAQIIGQRLRLIGQLLRALREGQR
jgi:hypothetical protein